MKGRRKVIFFTILAVSLMGGCSQVEVDDKTTTDKNVSNISTDNVKDKITSSNYLLKTKEEWIQIIESTTSEEISMSAEQRYELRKEIYSSFDKRDVSEYFRKLSNSENSLTTIIADDRYKELFDRNNIRWEEYDKNDLFGVSIYMMYIYDALENEALKNDLNRVKQLCDYGLENRDIIAIIDARRILRDIEYHLCNVPYFKANDERVLINEDDYKVYYGASEVLEGNNYKLLGEYK